jgi:hypothetical protein
MSRIRFATTALAAMLLVAPAVHAVDVQSIPGTDTKLSVYGFVQPNYTYFVDALQGSNYASSLFYNVPADGGPGNGVLDTHNLPKNNLQFQVKASRLGFATVTPSASLGDITTKLEFDLNNPNGTLGLRHAVVLFGGWTIGRYWSLWNDLDAGADTVDWAGAIGSACYDTPRLPEIQYAFKLDKNNTLAFSLEQNSGINGDGSGEVGGGLHTTYAVTGSGTGAVTTATTGVPVSSTGHADGRIPSLVAAYTYSDTWGHLAVRGLAQNYGAYLPATAATAFVPANPALNNPGSAATAATSSTRYSKIEGAGMVSGDVKFGKDDLIFNAYYGNALGQYGTGFQGALLVDAGQNVYAFKSLGWTLGYTHSWTDAVRSNIVLSGVTFSQNSDIDANQPAAGSASVNNGIKSGYQGFVNTFVKLAKNTEIGFEYIYEQAKPFANNGAVNTDAVATSKNSASKVEIDLHVKF